MSQDWLWKYNSGFPKNRPVSLALSAPDPERAATPDSFPSKGKRRKDLARSIDLPVWRLDRRGLEGPSTLVLDRVGRSVFVPIQILIRLGIRNKRGHSITSEASRDGHGVEETLAHLDLPTPGLTSGMAEHIRGGKLTVLNPVPPIRRIWLRASVVLSAKSQVSPILSFWIRVPSTDILSPGRLVSAIPEETINSVRSTKAISVVEWVLMRADPQQQPPPQPSQGASTSSTSSPSTVSPQTMAQPALLAVQAPPLIALPTASTSFTSTVSHQEIAQPAHPATQALSSPLIALQKVHPNRGPISGGDEILLVGCGFSEGQDLLVRFGASTMPVRTELVNPHNLTCTLPPSDSARCVSVTLHWQSSYRPVIQNKKDVIFTYEGVDKEMSV